MLKESQTPRYAVRRTHRRYSGQFKAELVAACRQPGASIAALALQHGMNANVLHRWLREWREGLHHLDTDLNAGATAPKLVGPDFIPLALSKAVEPPEHERATEATLSAPVDIRIECQRAGMSVNIHWPVSAAAQCTQLLRELLQ